MVSFSVDLEGFSLCLMVEAAPRVPRARRLRVEVGSGTGFKIDGSPATEKPEILDVTPVRALDRTDAPVVRSTAYSILSLPKAVLGQPI